jgi:hypothetical protein
VGARRTEEVGRELQRGICVNELIDEQQLWQDAGIRTHRDDCLFTELMWLVRDGRIARSEFWRWNGAMESRLPQQNDGGSQSQDLLNASERAVCQGLHINASEFDAVKDLILREYTFRDRLSKAAALGLRARIQHFIGPV